MRTTEVRGQLVLELDCAHCHVKAASFSPQPGTDGGLFACSVGPLSDESIAALDDAANEHRRVRLRFSEHPLLLDLVKLERKEPHFIRIVAQVVKAS